MISISETDLIKTLLFLKLREIHSLFVAFIGAGEHASPFHAVTGFSEFIAILSRGTRPNLSVRPLPPSIEFPPKNYQVL